ncbi:MAG TPA: Lrp/AsnC family transcriptional regulator [Thermomicrobiaceae bacterium]|nr:Lrp/AsnC family transcriptional regulator [Thermomicrobiaceae bacterium]
MPAGPEIDDLDLRIIAELQDDGRKPTTEIARALDVPRTTIARRIERLIAEHIITVGVLANGPRIGLPIQVIVEVLVDPSQSDRVIAAVTALDEVRWVGVASGPVDLLVEAMLTSQVHLRHFILRKLGRIEGITQLRTAHILEVAKIAFDWSRMLRAGEVAELEESTAPVGHGVLP